MGVMWALLGGCAFGLSNVFARMSMERVSPFTAVFWSVGANAVMFFPVAILRLSDMSFGDSVAEGIALFAAAGLFSHVGGRTALLGSAAHIGVSRAAAFRVAAPVVTVTFGVLVLGETLSWTMVVGLTVILGGLLLLTAESRETHGRRFRSGQEVAIPGEGWTETGPEVSGKVGAGSEGAGSGEPGTRSAGAGSGSPTTGSGAAGSAGVGGSETSGSITACSGAPGSEEAATAGASPGQSVRRGLLLGVIVALMFGSGDVLRKAGMNVLPDAWTASFVTSIGALLVLTVVAAAGGRLKGAVIPPRAALRDLILSGALSTAALFSFFQSLHYIPVSVATPVNGTQALFAALFGWLLNNSVEHVRGKLVGASVIVLVGLALIVLG